MKRTKRIMNTVFISLNALVIIIAVIRMMIAKQHMTVNPLGDWQWILPGMLFIPLLIVVNIVWLIVWCVKVKNKNNELK